MAMRFVNLLFVAALLAVIAGAAAAAGIRPAVAADENRVALVIGNAAYKMGALQNPVNDARAMAAVLKQIGFQVIAVENASKPEMERAVAEFGHALTPGSVALFYGKHTLSWTSAVIRAPKPGSAT